MASDRGREESGHVDGAPGSSSIGKLSAGWDQGHSCNCLFDASKQVELRQQFKPPNMLSSVWEASHSHVESEVLWVRSNVEGTKC
jgi:hypothetical protein